MADEKANLILLAQREGALKEVLLLLLNRSLVALHVNADQLYVMLRTFVFRGTLQKPICKLHPGSFVAAASVCMLPCVSLHSHITTAAGSRDM